MQKMFVINSHYYINKQILDSYLHTMSEKIFAMVTKVQNGRQIQKSSDLAKFGFQVDFDVGN
jgi:hypothetical protein